MENLLIPEKLENLLLKNWASFIDTRKMFAYLMQAVRDTTLNRMQTDKTKKSSIQIKLSRFELATTGFIIWADYSIPVNNDEVAVGTVELLLTTDGVFHTTRVVGTLFHE